MDLGSDACDRSECVALRKENAELKSTLPRDLYETVKRLQAENAELKEKEARDAKWHSDHAYDVLVELERFNAYQALTLAAETWHIALDTQSATEIHQAKENLRREVVALAALKDEPQ